MASIRVELRIHGRVQGVGYRASAALRAHRLGLAGFARNLDDGTVEVVAEGEETNVEELVAWCRVGPSLGHVTRVDIVRGPARGGLRGFSID